MKNIKLRYYLRGLGIGVLVTAFIMGTVGKDENAMTDAQIRERAAELGMVDSSSLVLSDLRNTAEDTAQETSENDEDMTGWETSEVSEGSADIRGTDADEAQTGETETTETEETDAEETEMQEADTKGTVSQDTDSVSETEPSEEQPEENATRSESRVENGIAYFEIVYGESSNSVSRILAELGLVEDAAVFDNYLCANGYSKRIHTGNYAVALGTSEEEIAKIITGNR